jgi:hypothetical protein
MSITTNAAGTSIVKFLSARRKSHTVFGLLGLATAFLLAPAAANAALQLTVSETAFAPFMSSTGASSLVVDAPSPPLALLPLGDFAFGNVVVSSTEGAGVAELTLNSATITNTDLHNVHTISLLIDDTDYNVPGGPGSTLSLKGAYSGTADAVDGTSGLATITSFADAKNDQDPSDPANAATTTSTSSPLKAFDFNSGIGDGTPTTFFQRSTVGLGLYSLAGEITITLSPGGSINLNDNTFTFANVVVPEPTSLGILAAGGLMLMRRRRRSGI